MMCLSLINGCKGVKKSLFLILKVIYIYINIMEESYLSGRALVP